MLANSLLQTCPRGIKGLVPPSQRKAATPVCFPLSAHVSTLQGSCRSLASAQPHRRARSSQPTCHAFGAEDHHSSSDDDMEEVDMLKDYLEVKVDSVRVTAGSSVVFLRLLSKSMVLPLHVGEAESAALLKEITGQKGHRPLTHDLAKHLLCALGARVTKIRITEMVNNIFYTRVHIARNGSTEELQLDARPSDAINLAVRFEAPMYINKRLVDPSRSLMGYQPEDINLNSESYAEIVKTVRDTLANFEDPTTVLRLEQELAVRDERYNDARRFQQQILDLMTHSVPLRLMVVMEAALADGRFDEAARVRDEYKRLSAKQQQQPVDMYRMGLGY